MTALAALDIDLATIYRRTCSPSHRRRIAGGRTTSAEAGANRPPADSDPPAIATRKAVAIVTTLQPVKRR